MIHDTRDGATIDAVGTYEDELDAWLAKPLTERQADMEKVQHVIDTGGPIAGWSMLVALGLPIIPDDLCDD